MVKGEKASDPLHNWRRKEKERVAKAKKKAREEKSAEIPAYRRDPAPLVSEIYRLSVLEYEGRLNSDTKQHKKRLLDQYQSIKKARTAAGLETVELVEFDPEAYEAEKAKRLQAKRQKLEPSKPHQPQPQTTLDERGLPKLPESPCPTDEELLSKGLPTYSPFPYELVDEDNNSEGPLEQEQDQDQKVEEIDDRFDDLEAKLEAEYELFKESLEDE